MFARSVWSVLVSSLLLGCPGDEAGNEPTPPGGSGTEAGDDDEDDGEDGADDNGEASEGEEGGMSSGGSSDSDAESSGGEPGEAPDPLDLGAQVDQNELMQSIVDLQDFETRYTFSNGDNNAKDYLVARLEAMGYTVELDPFTVDSEPVENVIARLPGAEEPNTTFIFSAHYDSTSEFPTTDAPGADDNASGVAAVLEAARIFAPHRFRYSVWFVLTAAEEQGSRGSAQMNSYIAADGADIQGIYAPDMIGYWPLGDNDLLDVLGDKSSEHLVDHMIGIADQLGVATKRWIRHDYCYGDDHTIYQEAGHPSITPMDCVEAHNIPASGETTPDYHRTTDTIGTLHMPFTTRVSAVIVAALADLAVPLPPE